MPVVRQRRTRRRSTGRARIVCCLTYPPSSSASTHLWWMGTIGSSTARLCSTSPLQVLEHTRGELAVAAILPELRDRKAKGDADDDEEAFEQPLRRTLADSGGDRLDSHGANPTMKGRASP